MYVIVRRLEQERMRKGMRDVVRRNRCVRDREKTRRRTDVKGKKIYYEKEQVCRWLGEKEKRNRCEGNGRSHEKEQLCRWIEDEERRNRCEGE